MQAMGSDLVFSFENMSNDSVEFMLYNDLNISCKRACVGRVDTIRSLMGLLSMSPRSWKAERRTTWSRAENLLEMGRKKTLHRRPPRRRTAGNHENHCVELPWDAFTHGSS